MDADVSPELLEHISKDFDSLVKNDKTAAKLLEQIRSGKGTYGTAGKYADRIGRALSKAFGNNLSSAVLPDGKMYWHIARDVLEPMMEEDYELVASASQMVQQSLNKQAGIGLKALKAGLDADQMSNFCHKITDAEQYDDVSWMLGREPLEEFSRSIVDQTLETNVDFQGQTGLNPTLTRTAEAGCCEWCASLAGVYNYPNVPEEVYHRHNNCKCDIEYNPGKNWTKYQNKGVKPGDIQNSWSKQWSTPENQEKIEERKKIGLT